MEGTLLYSKQTTFQATTSTLSALPDLSEYQLFHCNSQFASCSFGWWPSTSASVIANSGFWDETCLPYVPADYAGYCSQNTCAPSANYKTLGNAVPVQLGTLDEMKVHMMNYGPIFTIFNVCLDWWNWDFTKPWPGCSRDTGWNGHSVMCYGWDDNMPNGVSSTAVGAIFCKNSWGSGWGDRGFFKMAYGADGILSYGGQNWGFRWNSSKPVVRTTTRPPVITTRPPVPVVTTAPPKTPTKTPTTARAATATPLANPCNVNNGGCNANALCSWSGLGLAVSCTCKSPYTGDGYTCTLPSPCATNNGGCDPFNGICTNNNGVATCSCKTGFIGDGKTCTAAPGGIPRYVYITRADNRDVAINLAEIEVFDSNGAKIPASSLRPSMSAVYLFGPQMLIDGRYDTAYQSGLVVGYFAHTPATRSAWVQIDLGTSVQVSKVVVYNRQDCCGDRSVGLKIALLDANRQEINSLVTTQSLTTYTLTGSAPRDPCQTNNGGCDPVNGICTNNNGIASCSCKTGYTGDGKTCTLSVNTLPRYVYIGRADNRDEAINLAEIEVFDGTGAKMPSSSLKPSMSDVYYSSIFGPQMLTDGRYDTAYQLGSIVGYFAHTPATRYAWMQIELPSNTQVSKVVVYNRQDCCQARSVGLKISLLDVYRRELSSIVTSSEQPTYTLQMAGRA